MGPSAGNIARPVIKALYDVLQWYDNNPGAGKAPTVSQYYELWKDLHTLSVNISSKGWEALRKVAREELRVTPLNRSQEWRLLFAVETYLNMLMRAMALNKLGRVASGPVDFRQKIEQNRSLFAPSVF